MNTFFSWRRFFEPVWERPDIFWDAKRILNFLGRRVPRERTSIPPRSYARPPPHPPPDDLQTENASVCARLLAQAKGASHSKSHLKDA